MNQLLRIDKSFKHRGHRGAQGRAAAVGFRSRLGSGRRGVSRLSKQARPDLPPRDDIGEVLLMPCDAMIKLRSWNPTPGKVREAWPTRVWRCSAWTGRSARPHVPVPHTAFFLATSSLPAAS